MKNLFKQILAYILKTESRLVLWKYKPRVIAITGSVGKTSTKDAVYAVLSALSYVRKSEKSFNSEIGLPLSVLGIPNGWSNPFVWTTNILRGLWLFLWPHKYPKWLVLEAGVGKPGDMAKTAAWLSTDAVIVTAISETPVHIEFFDSREHLIEEKSELIKTLKPGGLLVLNQDDEAVRKMKEKTKCRSITFGFSEEADIRGSGDNISYNEKNEPEGVIFRVDAEGKSLPVVIDGVFGRNHIYASLAALSLASGLKFNILSAVDSLRNYDVPPGRMRLLKGIKRSLIIDDTYNSSPIACESALKTLGAIKCRIEGCRKIAVLGDMLELGKHTIDAHKNIGHFARENVEKLVVVGQRAKNIALGAEEAGMSPDSIFEFMDSRTAGEFLKKYLQKNDILLIKGSQGMRMERVVEEVMLEEDSKEKLLVRQDREWRNKK
jgi:UDP-N-acetylmuramoyl-tripeptide--D-alanyl-D-alanine ligase